MPTAARRRLASYVESCAHLEPRWRWVGEANLHLTLRFLGRLQGHQIDRLDRNLGSLHHEPFELGLDRLGWFGERSAVASIHLGVGSGKDDLTRLQDEVQRACLEAGLGLAEEHFRPHVTLARAPGRARLPLPRLPRPPDLGAWQVTDFGLFESRLEASGVVYVRLAEFGLGAAG